MTLCAQNRVCEVKESLSYIVIYLITSNVLVFTGIPNFNLDALTSLPYHSFIAAKTQFDISPTDLTLG